MSKVLLWETKTAGKPYYFSAFHQWIESYEELCYIISKRMIYFFVFGIPDDLKVWLREEFRIQLKSSDIKRQLTDIVEYKNFFTLDEKRELMERIRKMFLQTPSKKYWMLGEDFRKNRQYLSAFTAYEKALPGMVQLPKEEQAEIYYYMGICLCQMFQFEEALVYLKKGIETEKSSRCQLAMETVLFLTLNQEAFIQELCKNGKSENQAKAIYEQLDERKNFVMQGNEFVKLDKIAYHKKKLDDTMQNRLTKSMLEQWKDEYKREIS
ncbi:MAG: tetratricopeptide repeat protein [Anaerostipes sp.]|nr:tetratricopeptide repeat protein [Anaerostipes sp.]